MPDFKDLIKFNSLEDYVKALVSDLSVRWLWQSEYYPAIAGERKWFDKFVERGLIHIDNGGDYFVVRHKSGIAELWVLADRKVPIWNRFKDFALKYHQIDTRNRRFLDLDHTFSISRCASGSYALLIPIDAKKNRGWGHIEKLRGLFSPQSKPQHNLDSFTIMKALNEHAPSISSNNKTDQIVDKMNNVLLKHRILSADQVHQQRSIIRDGIIRIRAYHAAYYLWKRSGLKFSIFMTEWQNVQQGGWEKDLRKLALILDLSWRYGHFDENH